MNGDFSDPLQLDKCYICDKPLLNSEIQTHFLMFHESDPIKKEIKDDIPDENKVSSIQNRIVNSIEKIESHIVNYHPGENHLKCGVCEFSFKTSKILKHHVQVVHKGTGKSKAHSKQKWFTCQTCNENFESRFKLILHNKRSHEGNCCWKCDICEKHFSTLFQLQSHLEHSHLGTAEKKFACNICEKPFAFAIELTQHQNSVHSATKKYQCHICLKYFCESGTVGKHIKSVHQKETNFKCDTCDKTFFANAKLKIHMKSVHEQRNFECNKCSKAYGTNENLQRHIRENHIQTKQQLQCTQCPLNFPRANSLLRHIKSVHQLLEIYKCDLCRKTFCRKKSLNEHKRTHQSKKK